jgi:hypothetical protein
MEGATATTTLSPTSPLMLVVSPAAAPMSHADVSVTEAPSRVVMEGESVRLAFASTVNYVLSKLVCKRGNGQNLIVYSFCLCYPYVENGAIRSLNEGTGGRISNGECRAVPHGQATGGIKRSGVCS